MIRALIILLVAGSACRTDYKAEYRRGPGNPQPGSTVVLMPVPCHSGDDKCEDSYADAVTAMIANELEFSGYNVLDAEKLVREPRSREDFSASLQAHREQILAAQTRRQVGSIFEDLPPDARRELLSRAGAGGLVTGAVRMLPRGSGDNWVVQVQVRFALGDGTLVWVSRCNHESYWNEKDSWSIEQAAKCALDRALERS
jgi:hypothetical protein